MQTQPTTPFGRRPLSLAMVASQAATENFAARPGASETVVHKWRLFRALTEAKEPIGVTDRALSVLHALLSFHQETALTLPASDPKAGEADSSGPGIVVFPSNKELSIRAHGMAPATLRRHLACLVDAGLIIRRDSPNGKRFARRGQGGAIEDAFGFDLTPLVARAEEIENLAEEVRAENRAMALLREKITLTRRDIAKMIATGIEEGVPGDWEGFHLRYATLSGRYARNLLHSDLAALAGELAALAAEIRKLLETHVKAQNMSANESQSERHIQNQTTNIFDLEPSLREGRAEPSGLERPGIRGSIGARARNLGSGGAKARAKAGIGADLSARDGAGGLSRHPRFCFGRNFVVARSRGDGRSRSKARSACPRRLGAGAGGFGRARRVDRHRRDPAARGGNQKRRRLSARADREGEGRGVFARSRADGAVARQGGKASARAKGRGASRVSGGRSRKRSEAETAR